MSADCCGSRGICIYSGRFLSSSGRISHGQWCGEEETWPPFHSSPICWMEPYVLDDVGPPFSTTLFWHLDGVLDPICVALNVRNVSEKKKYFWLEYRLYQVFNGFSA